MKQIIAIGGGGFGRDSNATIIERYILKLARLPRPRVCFLPQASAEDDTYIVSFFRAFTKLKAQPSSLSFFGRVPADWANQLLAQDVIFVGGGNTKSMLAIWRDWGVDKVLHKALRNGTILAGVSAGAICWFDEGVTDSIWPLGTVEGLGFLKGSCCPHYDTELERRPAYQKWIGSGDIKPGIALEDGTAAHFIDGKLHDIVSTRKDGQAFRLSRTTTGFREVSIEATLLK